jgi:hypothetical protein
MKNPRSALIFLCVLMIHSGIFLFIVCLFSSFDQVVGIENTAELKPLFPVGQLQYAYVSINALGLSRS